MSRINHNNYEAFMLDMAEGVITPDDREELLLFLAQNPHLEQDLDGIAFATLDDEGIYFTHKDDLKKTASSRFDELAVKQIEQGLSTAEQAELSSLTTANPAYTKHLAAYKHTVLVADATVVFANKEDLKQGAAIRPLWYYSAAIAAGLALLVGVFIFNNNPASQSNGFAFNERSTPQQKQATAPQLADVTAPVETPLVAAKSNANNTTIPQQNNQVVYVQQATLQIAQLPATQVENNVNFVFDDAVALEVPQPYIDAEPAIKQGFFTDLVADVRSRFKVDIKDQEIAMRLDTIYKRGPQLGDLAFIGGVGIERLTGYRPNFKRIENKDKNESAISIGRYTIIATRKNGN
jgi:hypothetical protein